MTNYKVLVVEDNIKTQKRIATIITKHTNLTLQAAVATCAEAREQLSQSLPRVMIVDLDLPDGNGIELIAEVNELGCETESMVLTVFGDEKHVIDAIEAGATGYLLKDGKPETITDSVMALIKGGSPMTPSIARHLLKRFIVTDDSDSNLDGANKKNGDAVEHPEQISDENKKQTLTKRETEVLKHIARGNTFSEIAESLFLSPHTIIHHVKQIYKKLAVNSRGEAVYAGLQKGILDFP